MLFELESPRLIMRIENVERAKAVLDFYLRNREHLAPFEPDKLDGFFTERYHKTSLEFEMRKTLEGAEARYYVYEKDNPDYIVGVVNLCHIVRGSFNSASIGYKLDRQYTGRGYALEAVSRVLQSAYEDMHLHRVECRVVPYNAPSIRLLNRLNFTEEGLERKTVKIGGVWQDTLRYAIIFE